VGLLLGFSWIPRDFRRAIPVEQRAIDQLDCVISLDRKPYAVFEFKKLGDGDVTRYHKRVEKLLTKAEYLRTEYAVLTSFTQTVIYGKENERTVVRFGNPREYLSRFEELWRYLCKEEASQDIIASPRS